MSKEWKVEVAVESDLEKVLQGLDGGGFEIHGIFPAPDSLKPRFLVVGRRELPEGPKRGAAKPRPSLGSASGESETGPGVVLKAR